MIFWKNKKDWGGHDCCLALTEKEAATLVDALGQVENHCDIVVIARVGLRGLSKERNEEFYGL